MEWAFMRVLSALLKFWQLDCWGDSWWQTLRRDSDLVSPFSLSGWIRQAIPACSVIILESFRLVSFFIDLTFRESWGESRLVCTHTLQRKVSQALQWCAELPQKLWHKKGIWMIIHWKMHYAKILLIFQIRVHFYWLSWGNSDWHP